MISDDHPRSFLAARNMAFQNSDVVLFLGTRFNYVISHGQPPRFNPDAKVLQVNADRRKLARDAQWMWGLWAMRKRCSANARLGPGQVRPA